MNDDKGAEISFYGQRPSGDDDDEALPMADPLDSLDLLAWALRELAKRGKRGDDA